MDGFFGIGIGELILIAIVALIVLGPERLPGAFREIARFIRQVRNLSNEFTSQFGDEFKALEDLDPRRMLKDAIDSIDEEEAAKTQAAQKSKPASKSTTTSKTSTSKTSSSKTPANKTTSDKDATSTGAVDKTVAKSTTAKAASAQTESETIKDMADKSTAAETTADTAAPDTVAPDTVPESRPESDSTATSEQAPSLNGTHPSSTQQQGDMDKESIAENQIAPPQLVESTEDTHQSPTPSSAQATPVQVNGRHHTAPSPAHATDPNQAVDTTEMKKAAVSESSDMSEAQETSNDGERASVAKVEVEEKQA